MKNKRFFDWVAEMIMRIDYKRFNTYRPANNDTNIVFCFDNHTGKVGVARCNPSDNFNLDIGKAIAYARCRGYEVPKISTYKKFCELKNGDRFKWNSTIIYLFIGKSYGRNNEITYAIQNIKTFNIKQVSTAYYDKEVEMVD